MLSKYKYRTIITGLLGSGFVVATAMAAVNFSDPEILSDYSLANKTKLVRMGNGWLVSVYGDATIGSQIVYDTKADDVRYSRDIFVRVCHPAQNNSQCGLDSDWSDPLNISQTADLFSIATGWNESIGVEYPIPFYGDSEKPNIFVAGNFAVVTWMSKYCPGDKQRMISYTAREGLSVPFSCLYTSYTNNVAGYTDDLGDYHDPVWNTQQITDGSRDAKSDFNKGLSVNGVGKWVFSWQEDPHGLQLGGGEGPGEGASGATVTHGTDIWYTYTEDLMSKPLATPVRISDNYTNDGSGGNTSPIFHPDDPENEIEVLERGNTGASRPNLMLVGGIDGPTAVIAYEESKGAERLDSGKFIRYHEFAFNAPPVSNGLYENGEPGCIISDPLENSRRVRFVGQHTASPNGLRMGVFWRQGFPTEGGPADIMVRVGTTAGGGTGLSPEDMVPAVDNACRESDYLVARELQNTPASNISSNTVPWTPIGSSESPFDPNDLTDTSSLNPYEDAKAHRAAIVGDDLYIGYSYVKDWAVGTVIDLDNYNFWMRRYNAASGGTWTDAINVSNITDVKTHVKEPRLVKTPGSGMGCLDPNNITYPENCQDKSTLIVAWGTESNVYGHIGGSEEFDVWYTRTKDRGDTFETPAVVVPLLGANNRFESQLRPSPAGNIIWTVWNEAENRLIDSGPEFDEFENIGTHAMLSVSDESVGTAPKPPAGGETPPPPSSDDSYDLLIESLEMDVDDPQIVDGIYLVPPKTKGIPARVTVKNAGNLPVSGVVTVKTIKGGGFNYTFTLEELNSGETAVFDFTWDSRNKKSYKWQATVSPTDNDSDIDNNTMRVETIIVR